MEKKRADSYDTGYKAPEPVEIGRWYEFFSQEEIDKFNADMAAIERREYVYKPSPSKEEDEWYGDTIMLLFGDKDG